VLESVMRDGEASNATTYILEIMGMLKKTKMENNIEGISYLLPIVANLKMLLPKVWRQVVKRRPEIEAKLSWYTDYMLKNKFQIEEQGHDGIIWEETIFTMA
jgi:hypothetical protein